jgi:hypothetical protein
MAINLPACCQLAPTGCAVQASGRFGIFDVTGVFLADRSILPLLIVTLK